MNPIDKIYTWSPITDIPSDYQKFSNSELKTLSQVWNEQKSFLEETKALQTFNERLHRQWAIETGIIERVYTLDRGTTKILIEHGIDQSLISSGATNKNPELVARIIQDHAQVIEGLFAFVKGDRTLSTSYIKELHTQLLKHQDRTEGRDHLGRNVEINLIKGDYKKFPNNPTRPDGKIHEYCPPEQVASEMDRLIKMYNEHKKREIPPEVEAAWFHHRFSQIHPFQDGNGRVARALVTLMFIKAEWFPLTITRDDREKYINALEKADSEDLSPLVYLFASIHRKSFINALGLASDVIQAKKAGQVIEAARDLLLQRREALRKEWEYVKNISQQIQIDAEQKLKEVRNKLRDEVGGLSKDYFFQVTSEPSEGHRSFYYRYQIIETASELDYFANTSVYRAWARLLLKTETQAEVLISFHGIGPEFRGILVASMCFFRRDPVDDDEKSIHKPIVVCDELFQFNYKESLKQVQDRFDNWFDQNIVKALEMWRRGL